MDPGYDRAPGERRRHTNLAIQGRRPDYVRQAADREALAGGLEGHLPVSRRVPQRHDRPAPWRRNKRRL